MRFPSLILSVLLLLILLSPFAAAGQSEEKSGPVEVRGRVVCTDQSGNRLDECPESPERFALVGEDARVYTFSPTDSMAAIFTDKRVRQRELLITASLHAKDQLEIVKVQAIKEGKLYDIYYFCEVCNIKLYAPGPCPCCREEMEFRETPAPAP